MHIVAVDVVEVVALTLVRCDRWSRRWRRAEVVAAVAAVARALRRARRRRVADSRRRLAVEIRLLRPASELATYELRVIFQCSTQKLSAHAFTNENRKQRRKKAEKNIHTIELAFSNLSGRSSHTRHRIAANAVGIAGR